MNQFGKRRKRKLGGRGLLAKPLPASLKRMARNAGVKITLKRSGKRVYKSASMVRAQIKNKKRRRNHFGVESSMERARRKAKEKKEKDKKKLERERKKRERERIKAKKAKFQALAKRNTSGGPSISRAREWARVRREARRGQQGSGGQSLGAARLRARQAQEARTRARINALRHPGAAGVMGGYRNPAPGVPVPPSAAAGELVSHLGRGPSFGGRWY